MAIIEKPDIAQELMKWLNTRRQLSNESELNSLNLSLTALTYLDETAMIRAKELVECYSINRPDGDYWWRGVIDKTRVGDTSMYEFIAKGTDTTVEDIVDLWWKNSDFRSSGTTHMGCAVVYDEETEEFFYCMHHVERGADPTGESAYTNRYSVRPYTATITLKCLEKNTDINVPEVKISLIRSVAHEYMANNIKVNGKYIVTGYTPKKNTDFTTEAKPSVIENILGGDYSITAYISENSGYLPLNITKSFFVTAHGVADCPEQIIELVPYMVTVESYGVDENSVQTFVDGVQYELTFLSDGTLENAVCDGTDVSISGKSVRFTANSVTSVKYLPTGNYRLTELEPPEDHKKVQEITFNFDSCGNITDLSNAVLTDNITIKVVHSRNPPELQPLERHNVIKVYDLSHRQEDFGNGNNGLAVLHPSECESTKNADIWDISLVHPLDEWGKWKNLLPENVIEVRGQLFRIDEQTVECSETGSFITIHARHISGDMADDLIENATFEGGTAQNFIDFAISTAVTPFDEDYYEEHPDDYYHKPYVFTGYSDIETFLDGIDYTNTTLWGAIKGVDNCLINRYGGELYRDNFYFSVCKRMENARDNAFVIRFSDVSGISQCVDYTDFCTNLNCYDNFGNSFSVSYTGSSRDIIHHARRKMYKFNYKEEHTAFTQLGIDGMALWETVSTPKVSYTVNFCSAKSDPRFADFAVLQDFDYGDKGRIYCPELSIDTEQQIVEVVTDELTGEIISMKLGNIADTLVRPNFLRSTITTGRGISDNLDARVSKLELANTTETTS